MHSTSADAAFRGIESGAWFRCLCRRGCSRRSSFDPARLPHRCRGPHEGLNSRAFTLVELLLVIGVIAALVGVFLPAMSAARRAASSAKCLAHLKALAGASAAYANDDERDNLLPVHHVADFNTRHDEGVFDYGGASGGDNVWYGMLYGPRSGREAATRPLNRYLLGSVGESSDFSIYRCPSDAGLSAFGDRTFPRYHWDPAMNRQSMFASVGTSYWGNAWRSVEPEGVRSDDPQTEWFSFGPFLRPSSRIPASADTVLYAEAIARYAIATDGKIVDGKLAHSVSSVTGWHGRANTFNVSLCDGSARTVMFPPGRFGRIDSPLPSRSPSLWIRLGGIQFDCLPDLRIPDAPFPGQDSSRPSEADDDES